MWILLPSFRELEAGRRPKRHTVTGARCLAIVAGPLVAHVAASHVMNRWYFGPEVLIPMKRPANLEAFKVGPSFIDPIGDFMIILRYFCAIGCCINHKIQVRLHLCFVPIPWPASISDCARQRLCMGDRRGETCD